MTIVSICRRPLQAGLWRGASDEARGIFFCLFDLAKEYGFRIFMA